MVDSLLRNKKRPEGRCLSYIPCSTELYFRGAKVILLHSGILFAKRIKLFCYHCLALIVVNEAISILRMTPQSF